MESPKSRSRIKYLVIIGYIVVMAIMIIGLFAVYRNLVLFSEERIQSEDLTELILVGNVINQLYEVESTQNLYTSESADEYFTRYNSLKPEIISKIDSLKLLSKDSLRVMKLDSIEELLIEKEENLQAIAVLLDSIRKAPRIIRETFNTRVPKKLNIQIQEYLEEKGVVSDSDSEEVSDTTVVLGEQRGFFRRIGDAIRGRQDSTVIIQNRPNVKSVYPDEVRLMVDTVVNMVRYYERLDLENQQKFQAKLLQRQSYMSNTNHLLTSRIDDLLKSIEQEEIEKSIKLIETKESILGRSSLTAIVITLLAVLLAVVFGMLFLMDINKSQQYRRRLETSYSRINQLLKSREKLMLSISHDIKAPMSSILGYIELMESGADEDSRKMYLTNMKKSSDHVLQLVTHLLDYQKLESGTWARKEMNFNAYDLVENTATSFNPLAEKKQLKYRVFNKVSKKLLVFGDPFMIREVYSNLISNAIKYTPEGKVEVFVESVFEKNKAILKFSVRDTGLGITEEHRESIFQEFVQIKSDNFEHHVEGSGLGLAITKGLVDELGGTISLESEVGEGSEFSVDIPLELSRSSAFISSAEEDDSPDIDVENISVLVVDDDPIQLTMMAETLKLKKINVATEVRAENVLNILKNNVFDLIFLDIQMPLMNGFKLLKHILNSGLLQSKSTPIIALSAKSDLPAFGFKQSGFSGFLNKPFTSSQLFDLINKQLKVKLAVEMISKPDVKGIFALIKVVKDDKESSLEILKAFVHDTTKNIEMLRTSFEENDQENSSHYAHKMLPLFKMMGDEKLSDILLRLDHKEAVDEDEKVLVINEVRRCVDEAKELIVEIEKL